VGFRKKEIMLIRTLVVFALSLSLPLYACAQNGVKIQGVTVIDQSKALPVYVAGTDGERPKTTVGVIKGLPVIGKPVARPVPPSVQPAASSQDDKTTTPQSSN
jgi:hypothetical protein